MQTAKAVRWTARILSVPIVFVWAFFIVAYAVGPERSLPATFLDTVAYGAMIVSLLALVAAWKWEFVGSVLALVAVAIGAACNWRGLLSPAAVIPIDAVLFLLSWRLNQSDGQQGEPSAGANLAPR